MRKPRAVLSVDLGTSSLKVGVVGEGGDLLAYARVGLDGGAEWQEPGVWVRALEEGVGRVMPGRYAIEGIAVSGHGPTLVLVDEECAPLGPALMWSARTGRGEGSYYVSRMAYLAREFPGVYRRARWVMGAPEFLCACLTGRVGMISPSAAFDGVVWSEEEVRGAGLVWEKCPPFVRSGERWGVVRGEVAARWGLPSGVPVYAGGTDFFMALLGCGVVTEGEVCDRAGTSEGLNWAVREPVAGEGVRCLPHVVEGLWNVGVVFGFSGRMFEWFRGLSGQGGRGYVEMMEEIRGFWEREGEGWLGRRGPFFFPAGHRGEVWDFTHGVFWGFGVEHGRVEMAAAVVEALGMAVQDAWGVLRRYGCGADRVVMCGGQAKNGVWVQVRADMLGVRVVVPAVRDAELVGDACCAWKGAGMFGSLAEAAKGLVRYEAEVVPDERWRAWWEEAGRRYGEEWERVRRVL
ncbi:Carbohydrate kinase, FGGY [Spirochaeta thermophila DSM 6578]|uniref:Carbohydrate kinase, FGGY n=1 Tax=Winmispira thermophila (strain ATCC 700085 / DSM 6578 / Z-1203) TaxID=869211 RepID=G0GBM2_WINT7|nr:FGGY family carbohydrate kinase [Spirochaeta thermophila]AEJ61100.1 Carbohydrate kinase, FGGY [Spirochaeta thermophila DSM 6578]